MNGEVQQIIALRIACAAVLRGRAPDKFWPDAAVFKFCKNVSFVTVAGEGLAAMAYTRPDLHARTLEAAIRDAPVYAPDPLRWFARLASEGIDALQLQLPQRRPDRRSAGFVGGSGAWSLLTLRAEHPVHSWQARWDVAHQGDPEQRIWDVCYFRMDERPLPTWPAGSVAEARERLSGALRDIHAFATEHGQGQFAVWFAEALQALSSPAPELQELAALEPYMPLPVRQLLRSAARSWVFGGMGSWNDLTFDGEAGRRYETVSEALFYALCLAIPAATNACSAEPLPASGDSHGPS